MRTVHHLLTSSSRNPSRHADIISTLPDDLCGLILSFLPTKEAVATSVLSRRWCYLWASSPVLDLDFTLFAHCRRRRRKAAFLDFAAQALDLHEGPLTRFRVSLEGYDAHEPRLDDWAAFAVYRAVEDVELRLPRGKLIRVPEKIFACASLTALSLHMSGYQSPLPSPRRLALLKRLVLVSVSVLIESGFIRELCANCLMLEELVLDQCKIDSLEIMAPRLETLVLRNCNWIDPAVIKISAARLLSFSYSGVMADDHQLEDFVSIRESSLELIAPSALFKSNDESKSCLAKLVQALSSAKSLALSSWCTMHLSRTPRLLKLLHSGGVNVKHLELGVGLKDNVFRVVAHWLRAFPNLEILEVIINRINLYRKGLHDKGGELPEPSPNATAMNLRNVKLVFVDLCKNGTELVKFLLKNACGLETMCIVPFTDGLEYANFRRKVSKFKKASPRATVEFNMNA